jgi:hypothetical protein
MRTARAWMASSLARPAAARVERWALARSERARPTLAARAKVLGARVLDAKVLDAKVLGAKILGAKILEGCACAKRGAVRPSPKSSL